ncbi:uncharacterized protein LOC130263878 [Oenanthe melanoleuca]|uniref:uncharacterized protein LOC130263878 n=1 Tax=Oenanthe melanoleuca TaxID=2939378 RepID=UPI0024C1045E|nr:uncharacterized protein LOC130263878 [Oenanthe melanoleuca]
MPVPTKGAVTALREWTAQRKDSDGLMRLQRERERSLADQRHGHNGRNLAPCPAQGQGLLPAPSWGPAAQPSHSRGHVAFVPAGIKAAEASKSDRANGSDIWCSDCNRDLSCNEIVSIEERAFEPLPFLKLLNLSGNGLTHIPSGTFQAWHGMQFLQELILSFNPLAVIADPAFFKLPLVSSLDLSGTQATPQMLLLLLQTTLSLETLQVPKEVACCLCQERPLPESPCRSIQFLCEKLCSSSAPQCGWCPEGLGGSSNLPLLLSLGRCCSTAPSWGGLISSWSAGLGQNTSAHTSLLQTRAEIMDMEQPRKLNTSPVLSLKPKEPSLGGHGTVTLAVALTQSNEGDVSSLDNSRSTSYPPQHLLGHKGKTSVDGLRSKLKKKLLKKKLLKSKSIKTPKSLVPHQPQPARLKDVVKKAPSSWDHKQQGSRLNWQALNPWDVGGALNPTHDKSADRHLRDEVEDEAARQNYGSTHKQPKKGDSQHWVGHNQLFYETLSPVQAEGQPRATPVKAEQLLNRNLDFLSDPLVQSRPAVSSRGVATAEREHSSLGWHPLIIPDTTEEADSMFLNKPRRAHSPHLAPVPGELLETTVSHHLRLLVPDKGLQRFMAHMERALRMDCSLPQLKHACAKMVSKTRLLLKVLIERQENKGASDYIHQCHLQEHISRSMTLGEDNELAKKKAQESEVKFVILLSLCVIIGVMLKVFFHLEGPGDEPQVPLQMLLHVLGTTGDVFPSLELVAASTEPGSCCAPFKKFELRRKLYEAQKSAF